MTSRGRFGATASGLARLLAFGAVFGTLCDGFHTYGGATAYAAPVALRMAWWTAPLFAGAYALMGVLYASLRRGEPLPDWRRAAAAYVAFSALYFSSGFLPAPNLVKALVLLVGAALLFALVDRSKGAFVVACVAAVVGPSFEVVLVHFGAFAHLRPDALGVPVWLPALYFASGPGLGPLAARILTGAAAPDTGLAAARALR